MVVTSPLLAATMYHVMKDAWYLRRRRTARPFLLRLGTVVVSTKFRDAPIQKEQAEAVVVVVAVISRDPEMMGLASTIDREVITDDSTIEDVRDEILDDTTARDFPREDLAITDASMRGDRRRGIFVAVDATHVGVDPVDAISRCRIRTVRHAVCKI